MSTPTPRTEELSVVLLGGFNPSIFHPTWFIQQGLLPEDVVKDAHLRLCAPADDALMDRIDGAALELGAVVSGVGLAVRSDVAWAEDDLSDSVGALDVRGAFAVFLHGEYVPDFATHWDDRGERRFRVARLYDLSAGGLLLEYEAQRGIEKVSRVGDGAFVTCSGTLIAVGAEGIGGARRRNWLRMG